MKDKELRRQLDKLMKQVEDSDEHWRFNFSVGLNSGSCYGSSFEDETKLKKDIEVAKGVKNGRKR